MTDDTRAKARDVLYDACRAEHGLMDIGNGTVPGCWTQVDAILAALDAAGLVVVQRCDRCNATGMVFIVNRHSNVEMGGFDRSDLEKCQKCFGMGHITPILRPLRDAPDVGSNDLDYDPATGGRLSERKVNNDAE